MPRINKYVDLIDRVVWTFIQTFIASLTLAGLVDGEQTWYAKLGVPALASLLSAGKTVIGQNTGKDDTGAIVPGKQVVQP